VHCPGVLHGAECLITAHHLTRGGGGTGTCTLPPKCPCILFWQLFVSRRMLAKVLRKMDAMCTLRCKAAQLRFCVKKSFKSGPARKHCRKHPCTLSSIVRHLYARSRASCVNTLDYPVLLRRAPIRGIKHGQQRGALALEAWGVPQPREQLLQGGTSRVATLSTAPGQSGGAAERCSAPEASHTASRPCLAGLTLRKAARPSGGSGCSAWPRRPACQTAGRCAGRPRPGRHWAG
jgi:hypothetical protein